MLVGAISAALAKGPMGWGLRECGLFWLATTFVDSDHYLNLVFWSGFRCFSPRQLFRFYASMVENNRRYPVMAVEPFHTLEFVLLLGAAAFGAGPAYLKPVFWGIVFHLAVDVVHLARLKALRMRKNSFIGFWLANRALARRGIDGTLAQKMAIRELLEARV